MVARYYPESIPKTIEELPEYIQRQYLEISDSLSDIDEVLDRLYIAGIEEAILDGNAGTFGNNATVTNWNNAKKPTDPNSLIQIDPVTGIITLNRDGYYNFWLYAQYTGSNNNAYYGTRVNFPNGIFYAGSHQWDNNNPFMVDGVYAAGPASIGSTVSMEVFTSIGTLNLTAATMGVSLTRFV